MCLPDRELCGASLHVRSISDILNFYPSQFGSKLADYI